MEIREGHEVAINKLEPLSTRIASQYGLVIDFGARKEDLLRIYEHYTAKKEMMISTQGEYSALHNPDYAKAVLISETVRMYLREIAPKRTRKKKK